MTGKTDIDRLLGDWLALGSERAPEDAVAAALDRAVTVRQRGGLPSMRWVGRMARKGHVRQRLFATALTFIVLIIVGLGIGIRTGLIRLPTPTVPPAPSQPAVVESPTPDPVGAVVPLPDDSRTYRYADAGFEITLSDQFRLTSGSDPTTLTATSFGMRLFVTSGDAAGRVRNCSAPALPWEECREARPTDLDSLAVGIRVALMRGGPIPTIRQAATTLNGRDAVLLEAVGMEPNARGGQAVTYIAAMRDGRPFILRFWSSSVLPIADVQNVAAGFRFLSPLPPFAAGDPDLALERYTNAEAGYSVLLPHRWIEAAHDATDSALPGSTAVVFEAEGPDPLKISVGTPGSMTLGELEDILVSTPRFYSSNESHDYRFLDRDLAGVETPAIGTNCLGCPQARIHVYAIHDGRPVVLAFDYWMIRFGSLGDRESRQIIDAITDSFEFTE